MLKGTPVATLSHLQPEYRKAVLQSATALSKYTGENRTKRDFWRAYCLFVARVAPFAPERSEGANAATRRVPQLTTRSLRKKMQLNILASLYNHKQSWNEHICSIVKKANSSTGFLRRNLQIHQKHIKANAYKTLVRLQIKYASTIWDLFTQENQNKIEMAQRRAARFACNNYRREASVTTMLDELGLRSLKSRPKINYICYTKL